MLIAGLMLTVAVLLAAANRRWDSGEAPLVEAINAALPQTQCAACGYPGCLPYARAVANNEAALDLCPPGGDETYDALVRLLPDRAAGGAPEKPVESLAVIDESACIGCFLCVHACPVDAIVGAPGWLHTVLDDDCTGCELCVPPCPVDCIEMVAR